MKKRKPVIVALDVETEGEALTLVRHLSPWADVFKIGPVMFMKYGGGLLQKIRTAGAEVFLDMKFHDIPSVVAKAISRAAEWGVYSATIHTSGGAEMMRQTAALRRRPLLWGVTVLTSLDGKDLKQMGVGRGVPAQAERLAKLAQTSGLDGVIASVQEARRLKQACGPRFQVVTPGIRLAAAGDDQKRAQTPADAIRSGSDFMVIGRPIIEAKDPVKAIQEIYHSIEVRS